MNDRSETEIKNDLRRIGVNEEFLSLWAVGDLKKARHFWLCVCGGDDVDFSFEKAKELEEKGLLENVCKLPGRGRYANRWQAIGTDLLYKIAPYITPSKFWYKNS